MNVLIATVMLAFSWPEPATEMKPWVYNWWMGSAVNEALEFFEGDRILRSLKSLADVGHGCHRRASP